MFDGGGPGGFDMSELLAQAQAMQNQLLEAQANLENQQVEGSAGGGLVTATVSGTGDLLGLTIKPEAVDPEDTETLADLVVAAVRDAAENAKQLAAQAMGPLAGGLPGMGDAGGFGAAGEPGSGGLGGLPGAGSLGLPSGIGFQNKGAGSPSADSGDAGPGGGTGHGARSGPETPSKEAAAADAGESSTEQAAEAEAPGDRDGTATGGASGGAPGEPDGGPSGERDGGGSGGRDGGATGGTGSSGQNPG